MTAINDGSSNFKRASSLDTLSGMMPIGKRSAETGYPIEFVNMEPYYTKQYPMRPFSRLYDMRWTPMDIVDTSGENI